MKKEIILFLVASLLCVSCESGDSLNNESQSTYNFEIVYENTGITKDNNDYFHLIIDRNSWQTLYRVRGIAYKDDVPIPNIKFNWQSNLFWELGDTLGY